jgi:hypothetical protein
LSAASVRVSALSIVSTDVSGLATVATTGNFDDIGGSHKPANNADVTLTAINGGLVITSGGITLNGSPSIKSNNYVAGVPDGRSTVPAMLNSAVAVIRGTLYAGDVTSGTLPTSVLPTGVGPTVRGTLNAASTITLTGSTAPTSISTTVTTGTLVNVFINGYLTNNGATSSTFAVILYIDGVASSPSMSWNSPTLAASGGTGTFNLFQTFSLTAGSHTFTIYATGFPESITVNATLTVQ